MAKLRLAGVIRESIVDGPGIRMTIFTQGCPHHCKGCHNEQTWDFEGGYDSSTECILEEAQKDPILRGLTFSGGEPFCQAEALSALAKEAKEKGYDIFCYTGFTFEKLVSEFDTHPEYKELLTYCDWLVDGPFVLSERSLMLKFRGSKNQRILDVKKSLETMTAIETEV